jgi:hypothetical protein
MNSIMRRIVVVGIALLSIACPLHAQNTWSGLRFGMKVEEVKRQVSGQAFELRGARSNSHSAFCVGDGVQPNRAVSRHTEAGSGEGAGRKS